jgi:hypothetical protein
LLITVVGILVLGVGALEILFRIFVTVTDVPVSFWDPLVGPRLEPNQTGRFIMGSFVNGRYHINSQGWNHPQDYRVQRTPGAIRVALVGDSQVEALQVDLEDAMFTVAERRMSRPGRPAEWYTFGRSGFGTAQELQVIRKYVLDYHPDVVVLLFVQNDPFDTSPYLVDPGPHVPVYSLDPSGELVLHFPAALYRPAPWRRLIARSALGRYFAIQRGLLERVQALTGRFPDRPGVGGLPLREPTSGGRERIPDLSNLTLEERQRRTWQLIEALLRQARDESRHRGARFALAFRGAADEIDSPLAGPLPPSGPPTEDPYCLGSRIREMGPAILEPMARRLEIPYLDLGTPLQAAVARTGKSHRFPDDNHYGVTGHAAAGEALAVFVESILASEGGREARRPVSRPAVGRSSEPHGGAHHDHPVPGTGRLQASQPLG